ncbi:MAG: hypothetical protein P4L99_07605 [Chthoniobacter sp.]|nr:hypothetical protein [Chthoniobacter sp.]
MKTFILVSFSVVGFFAASVAETPTEVNANNATRTQVGASARDGFTLRGAEVVMTRGGVTTKVEREFVLPNGMHVQANGSITTPGGGSTALRPNQLLTFDGAIQEVALTSEGVAPVSSVAPDPAPKADVGVSTRDGITAVGGEAFLTRNGVREKIKADVRLANGAVAKSDGSVVMSNGNSITLRADQLLDLSGVLHDVRVRPAATGLRTTAPR